MKRTRTRRNFLKTTALGALAFSLPSLSRNADAATDQPNEYDVFVGTYTTGGSEGIYAYRFDATSGELKAINKTGGVSNPSYLAVDPQQRYLFAVNEISKFDGQSSGAVSAFSIDAKTGGLTFINQQPSMGASPCYVSVDKTGKWALVANYTGGSVSVLPIGEGGKLGAPTDTVQHHGSSVNPQRQREPHTHSILLDPANRFAYVPDLGLDKVVIYRFDSTEGKLKPNDPPFAQVKPGAGPRHFTFHPNGKFAFLIQEINSTLTSFAYEESNGSLKEIQTVSALPEGYKGNSNCADVHVSPNGKFLYGSNRGHNSIVIFAIDEKSGKLTYVGHEPTQGKTPRNFAIDPTGTFLLAANQDTNNIVTFRIDPQSGKLSPTGQIIKVSMPVCIKFMPISKVTLSYVSRYEAQL